jgi:hypothetical protein
MSRILQWILGILAVIVIVGLVVGAVFMWRNNTAWSGWGGMMYNAPGAPNAPDVPQAPDAPYRFERHQRYHMDDWYGRMPMHGYAGPYAVGPFQTGFLMFAGLLRLVLPLGLLALVAYIFYQMGKRAGAASPVAPGPASRPNVNDLPSRKIARR